MKTEIRDCTRDQVKAAFREHLRGQDITERTISTYLTDVFYIWDKCGSDTFWDVVCADDFETVSRATMTEALNKHSKGNVEANVNGYISTLRRFRDFIGNATAIYIPSPKISRAACAYEGMIDINTDQITSKNIILCGTPGTGKTYSTVQYAVAIIEERSLSDVLAEDYGEVFARYLKYKDDRLVAFTTFHQSFGYEEFIEGIRPVVASEEGSDNSREIEYEVHVGVFKAFCDKAGTPIGGSANVDLGIGKKPTVWKVSLGGTGDNPTREECLDKSHIRIGWDGYGEAISDATDYSKDGGTSVLNAFYNRMQIGDIVFHVIPALQ